MTEEAVEAEEDKTTKRHSIEEGCIIRTWGTGTGKTTMSLHVRKAYYKSLGWEIGDFVYMMPDVENKRLIIKKVDISKLQE